MAWMTPIVVAANQRREEELLLEQLAYQLGPAWELKILHSMGHFASWDVIGPAIEEEAAAGWQIMRQLDDSRLIFKRPVYSRQQDHLLPPGMDAYRAYYGVTGPTLAGVVTGLLLLALVIAVVLTAGI